MSAATTHDLLRVAAFGRPAGHRGDPVVVLDVKAYATRAWVREAEQALAAAGLAHVDEDLLAAEWWRLAEAVAASDGVTIWQAGRSGGWCVLAEVDGKPVKPWHLDPDDDEDPRDVARAERLAARLDACAERLRNLLTPATFVELAADLAGPALCPHDDVDGLDGAQWCATCGEDLDDEDDHDDAVRCVACGCECDATDAVADDCGLALCGSTYGNGCADLDDADMLLPAEVAAHLLNAAALADCAADCEAGRLTLADGRASSTLSPAVRDLLTRELAAQSHAIHEWLLASHGVPMRCRCALWCEGVPGS